MRELDCRRRYGLLVTATATHPLRVPRHAVRQPVRALPLLGGGIALRFVAEVLRDGAAAAVAIAGLVALMAFVAANLHLPGTIVVGVGVLLNLVVVTANGAMPLEKNAAVAAGLVAREDVDTVELRGPRRFADSDDSLRVLDDRMPMRPVRQVLSIGDLILLFGLADLGVHLVRRARR